MKEVNKSYQSKWWNVLCFFFPLVGFILFLVYIDEDKKFSKRCGLSSLFGFILYLIVAIISFIFILIYSYFYIIENGGI